MINTETQAVVQATFADTDALYEEVENVIDVLPNELGGTWFDGLGDDPGIEENELVLRLGFWEAARDVIKAMLLAGYTLTPPKG